MLRLFVGIALPREVRQALEGLHAGIQGARWVPAENMHITLVFIGEIDEGVAEDVHETLSAIRAPAFETRISGLGHFASKGKARALWAAVERAEPLMRLQEKVGTALAQAGVEAEHRKYRPHVTLARLRDAPLHRVGGFLEAHNAFAAGPFGIDRFILFRSRLGGEGATYEALAEYPLQSSSA